ncbi:ATPase [Colletotrichum falcatum]|nr:ATPase [Colletotrichum falcatum]
MSSRRTHQRPPATVRERSVPDPDERYYRGRKVRSPFRPRRPARIRSVSRSPSATEQGEYESSYDGGSSRSRSPSPAQVKYRRPPIVTVDWRSEICRFLNLSNQVPDHEIFEALAETEGKLRDAERLKYQYTADSGPPRSQVMHRIHCHHEKTRVAYQDEPWPVESGPYHAHLRGSRPVANLELYLERNKNIGFLVFREYQCCHRHMGWERAVEVDKSTTADASLFFSREYIDLVSPELQNALTELSELALDGIPHPLFGDEDGGDISHPYLWWFHRRKEIAMAKPGMDPRFQQHVDIFQTYIEDRMQPEWEVVDGLFAERKITVDLLRYLFVPNDLIIAQTSGGNMSQLNGSTAKSWLVIERADTKDFRASIMADSWGFDGSFHNTTTIRRLDHGPVESLTENFDITTLPIYPARFAEKSIVKGLRERGKMFWSCRRRKYVSYVEDTQDAMQSAASTPPLASLYNGSRFMVDLETYNMMHPPSHPSKDPKSSRKPPGKNELVKIDMESEKPPAEDSFLMCLPSTMKGFDMNAKTWRTLEVAFMRDVVWNREAFKDLVIEPKTKDLVKAVVMNRLTSEENTDLIQGKGNGLFILLHGGPGTGKTLTAESVAEIAEKPLYKVTCGDVGTKPDEVEKYLEVVTLLGKTWGCVVLLDEADVFLEQRSLANLKRNALVSVFLRVLEYYDGILILTTNRVGTFDEAFKSRIQLNLRYNTLDEEKRLRIWANFVTRLEERTKGNDKRPHDYGIDSDSIRGKLQALAAEKLNGREIRNAISTARQLASFKREPMDYGHLRSVITEAKNFEQYLVNLNQGHSADEIQHDIGAR